MLDSNAIVAVTIRILLVIVAAILCFLGCRCYSKKDADRQERNMIQEAIQISIMDQQREIDAVNINDPEQALSHNSNADQIIRESQHAIICEEEEKQEMYNESSRNDDPTITKEYEDKTLTLTEQEEDELFQAQIESVKELSLRD